MARKGELEFRIIQYDRYRMKITRQDLLTPANLISFTGLVLTIVGSLHFQTLAGFLGVTFGRILDVLDGPVARRTHTSRFGAVLDATIDKFSILAIVTGLLAYSLAPIPVILYIMIQNGLSSAVIMIASHRHIIVHSSKSGKLNVFFQTATMILFAGSEQVTGVLASITVILAYLALMVSVVYAARATLGYYRNLSEKSQS